MVDPYRPTGDYREGYDEGYKDGFQAGWLGASAPQPRYPSGPGPSAGGKRGNPHPKKRKLSAWNKFVKANSKKPRFVYRSGKLNLKKMGVAFRKTPAGKKGKR